MKGANFGGKEPEEASLGSAGSSATEGLKMIAFIESLYSKYKVLNRLSERESNLFQNEVIEMLMDENQNLDVELYQNTVEKIGIPTFVLEVLSSVVSKNTLKSQFEVNKNLSQITRDLERQQRNVDASQRQLLKLQKELESREHNIKKKEETILSSVRRRISQMEEAAKARVLKAQVQVRKRIGNLMGELQRKEKLIVRNSQQFKEQMLKVKNLEAISGEIETKSKQLEALQKSLKGREASVAQGVRKVEESASKVRSLEAQNARLSEEVRKMAKRIKTNELAYRHIKDEAEKRVELAEKSSASALSSGRELERLRKQLQVKAEEAQVHIDDKNQKMLQIQRLIEVNAELQQKITQIQKQEKGCLKSAQVWKIGQQKSEGESESDTAALRRIRREEVGDMGELRELEHLEISKIQHQGLDSDQELTDNFTNSALRFQESAVQERSNQFPVEKESDQLQGSFFSEGKSSGNGKKKDATICQNQESILIESYFPCSGIVKENSVLNCLEVMGSNQLRNEESWTENFPRKGHSKKSPKTEYIESINEVILSESQACSKIQKVGGSTLNAWIYQLQGQLKMDRHCVQKFIEVIELLIEPCQCPLHQKAMQLLFDPEVLGFLQQAFLKFQALDEKIEASCILTLCRTLLHNASSGINVSLNEKYVKALTIRKIAETDPLILSNIEFLLNFHVQSQGSI